MSRTLKQNDRLAHYRIVGPLGAGGMGEVYRATDETLERDVALKILPPEVVRSEERLRRFVLEAKSASSLNHPGIVTIYEIGRDRVRAAEDGDAGGSEASEVHYISMELVAGETLSTKIHMEKTDLRTLLGWLAQAAEGLGKAHAAGIVHRDLKPGNIMISRDGFAKVLDFGLAKLTEKGASDADRTSAPTATGHHTGEGVVLGTVGYMSPEQVQGRPVDHRSDVFSFGCVLYEAATRRRPFVADSDVETMHKILHDSPPDVEEINPEAPAALRRLIRRCLAKNPEQRFQSIKDLGLDLREIADDFENLSASASSGSGAIQAPAEVRPGRRILVPGIVGAALLIAAAGVVLGLRGMRAERREGTAGPPAQVKISALTSRGDVSDCVISPDGRLLAYVAGEGDSSTLWVRQVTTGSEVSVLPLQQSRPRTPAFTPDGSYLFYRGPDPERARLVTLFQIPALGGSPRKIALDVDSGVSFAPDGKRICFIRSVPPRSEDALVVRHLESGEERTLATVKWPRKFHYSTPSWSPDGAWIATIEAHPVDQPRYQIVTIRVEDGRREPLEMGERLAVSSLAWLPDGNGLIFTAARLGDLGPGQLWLIPFPAGSARPITNDWNSYFGVSISADGSTVAARRGTLVSNIWVAGADRAGPVRQLTFESGPERPILGLDTARDGSIVFDQPAAEASQFWRIDSSGSDRRQILPAEMAGRNPMLLPSGGIIFNGWRREETPDRRVYFVQPDGEQLHALTEGPADAPVRISPDGTRVVFRRVQDLRALWSIPVTGGTPVQLTTSSYEGVDYSHDGTRLLIRDRLGRENELGQYVFRAIAASDGAPIATIQTPVLAFDVEWGPDSRQVLFLDEADAAANIFALDIEGGPARQITHFTEGRLVDKAVSPDGRRILLSRRQGRVQNLWVTGADGTRPVPITDFEAGQIFFMTWAKDSRSVVFTYGSRAQEAVSIRDFR